MVFYSCLIFQSNEKTKQKRERKETQKKKYVNKPFILVNKLPIQNS